MKEPACFKMFRKVWRASKWKAFLKSRAYKRMILAVNDYDTSVAEEIYPGLSRFEILANEIYETQKEFGISDEETDEMIRQAFMGEKK